jgi:hypothetical protein
MLRLDVESCVLAYRLRSVPVFNFVLPFVFVKDGESGLPRESPSESEGADISLV